MEGENNHLLKRCQWAMCINPYTRTCQDDIERYIIENKVLICPFGHIKEYRRNVLNGIYNINHPKWGSSGQDKMFVEDIVVGSTVIVLFSGTRKYLIVGVMSSVCQEIDFNYSYTDDGALIRIQPSDEIDDSGTIALSFLPVVKRITVLGSGELNNGNSEKPFFCESLCGKNDLARKTARKTG